MIESIKITELNDIGAANLTPNVVFPMVNMTGTPITDKGNLQIVGNYILSQAGGANFVQAAQATLAQSVVNAAQPNITSVGTLTSLTVSGAVNLSTLTIDVANLSILGGDNGYVLQTDGEGNLSWTAQTGGGGGNGTPGGSNTQVQFNDAGEFGGNTGFTFNKTSGLLSAPFISGNGSNLTGVTAASVAGANVTGQVSYAATANSVAAANVSGLGNVALINKDGNSSNVLYGNGTFAALTSSTGAISFVGNAEYCLTGIIIENADMSHGATAALVIPSNGNTTVPVQITNTYGNVAITAGENTNTTSWTFASDGSLYAPGNTYISGDVVTVGPGANTLAEGLSNPALVVSSNSDTYIQAAINNVSDIGSADWAAYGHHGNDLAGWTDMGFASASFSDPNYTITGGGDGYLFVQGYIPGQAPFVGGGNLVLATGGEGTTKDIVFATGGFLSNNEFARFDHANDLFHLTRANTGIQFHDGTIQTTAYTGNAGGIQSQISNGNSNVNIATADGNITLDANGNVWTFDINGVLTFPGSSLTIGNLAGAPTIQSAANLNLQLLSSGDGGVADLVWFDDVNSPSKVAAVVVNNPLYVGDADVGIVTGNILGGGGNTYVWNFGNDGTLALPSQGNIVGLTPDNSGYMQWVGNSSGDGSGYTTLRLIPDETLVAGDQYLIIDPTAGGHIHIRAGGTQDASYGQLYLGAEQNFVRVVDNQGLTLQNQLVTQNTNNYADPADFTSATWFVDGGSYYIQYTSTNAQLDADPYQYINNIYVTWNTGADSATLTYGGATQNLGGGVYKVSVIEAPPADPTALETIAYTLNITTTNTVTLDSDGFNVSSQNDVTLIGNGYVELTNTSNTEGVLIRTDGLGNAHNWLFNSQGQTITPVLNTARGDNPSGTISGYTLNIGDGTQEAIITTPDGDPTGYQSSQRLVINPGKGADGTGGEGGDIYLWAGRGGTGDGTTGGGSGGDIKIRGGQGMAQNAGGYIRIEAGDSHNDTGQAGYVEIRAGRTTGGYTGYVDITGGDNANGQGGNVTVRGGYGTTEYGNVVLQSNTNYWTFDNTGNLSIPNNINNANVITANYFAGDGSNLSNINSSNIIGVVANASYADTAGTVVATGNINANSFYINNLATPMQSTDAATKAYVDNAATGLHIHDPVAAATVEDLATTTGGTIAYNNGVSGVGANLVISGGTLTTIDAVSLTANMRVMIKDEANGAWNGVYVYNNNTTLTRATDFDDEVQAAGGDYFFVDAGYVNGKTSWVQVTANVVVGVDPMNFVQFSAAGSYNAGTGLTLSGSTFSVNASQTQITSVGTLSNLTVSGQITSTQATGVAPFAIASTTKVANLNVEQVDGYHADITNTANTLIVRDANGNVYATSYFGEGNHLSNINVANITGIGNIATLNLDGNASNILYGNGSFAAVPVSYGNSNVATFLANYGSNTIVTTGNVQVGNIIGNGQALTGINGANVTGTVANATHATTAGTANSVAGANVTGTVTSATNAAALLQNTSSSTTVYPTFTTSSANGNSSAVFNTSISANLANASVTATTFVGNLNGNVTGNITGNTGGFAIGYRDIPQISFTGNATTALTDAGKHYYSTLSTANTLTISNSATSNFSIGTAINIVNQGTANILVNAASGVTLYLAGNSTAGNRVVTSFGMATIQKVGTDTWFIVGAGVQ